MDQFGTININNAGEDPVLTSRATMALDAALRMHPVWKLRPHTHLAERQAVIKAVAFTDFLTTSGYSGLIQTEETNLVSAILAHMHPGSLVVNNTSDWTRYNGELVTTWNNFKADPNMLPAREFEMLTRRTPLMREVVFNRNQADPFAVRLRSTAVVLLFSENTLGDVVGCYDMYGDGILHGTLVQLVENIHRIARLLPILEPEMVIEESLPEMRN